MSVVGREVVSRREAPIVAPMGAGSLHALARNALVPMAAGLLGKGLDFAFALVYLRVLRDEGTAVFTFLVVFTTYLDTLINFGFNTLLARDVGKNPRVARAAFRAVALTRLGLWLLGLPLVAIVLGPVLPYAGLPASAALAGWLFYLALVPSSVVASTASGLLWAAERLEIPAIVSVLTTVLKITLGVIVLLAGFGLMGLAATSLVVNLVTAVVLVSLTFRLGLLSRGREASDSGRWLAVTRPGSLIGESWPLFVNQLLAGLFFKIDSQLLPGLAGLRQAGVYSAAYRVIDGLGVISSSFTLAVFPRLARDADAPGAALARGYRLCTRTLLQVALPLAAGTALLAEPIIGLVGGPSFLPDGALALTLLISFLPFSYFNGLTQYVLIALGRQRALTAAFVVAVIFNLTANLLLIPRWGFVGAAVVTVASELVLLVPFTWLARQHLPSVSPLRELREPLLATLLMAPVVWWLRDAIHPAAAVAAGALVYPIALWSLGGIDPDQRAMLRSLLRRK